jgi:polysaccharide pyruvyl transferase CsaB
MATRKEVFRVGISGSYGGLNLGDEAILQVIITELSRTLPVEFTVFSRNSEDTRTRHAVGRVIPVRELSRGEVIPEIERLDLLIVGGGGILFDAEAAAFLREATLAQEAGVPVMLYAIGAGPLDQPATRELVGNCLQGAQAITVRERRARQLLEDVGVRQEIRVTADPAFLLEAEPLPPDALKQESLEDRSRLVGVSVREPGVAAPDIDEKHYHALLANAADYMVDRLDADLVFVPMEHNVLDVQHSHRVIGQMAYARRATVLKGEYTPGQMLSLVGQFDFVVGMRLHFLIFAALQRVPFVALPYASKVMGLLEAFEMAAPPMQQVNAGQLIAHIDRSWDLRNDLRNRMGRVVASLQERARENNAIACQLLTAKPAAKSAAGGARS